MGKMMFSCLDCNHMCCCKVMDAMISSSDCTRIEGVEVLEVDNLDTRVIMRPVT